MKNDERRRYFRINEQIGLSIRILDRNEHSGLPPADELISQQDERIEQLLRELADTHPQVGELVALLNQKLERTVAALAVEKELVDRIAHRVQEVNLSACGIAFHFDESLSEGSHLQLELTLFPSMQRISTKGLVVACQPSTSEEHPFYCRVDFYGMGSAAQESLIQYVVQSQAQQLKQRLARNK